VRGQSAVCAELNRRGFPGKNACRREPLNRSIRTLDGHAASPLIPLVTRPYSQGRTCAILPAMDSVEVEARERVHIRMRETASTLAAWRVSLRSPAGAIVLAEAGGKVWYRGEGALLGEPQDRLAELWKLALSSEESAPELPQYG
jgi:hypothetical protein